MHQLKNHFNKTDQSILIANALDHFDVSIYSFIAPKIAPLFFPNHDSISQLVLAYSILMSSIVTQPIGVCVFGMIAKKKGPIYALSYSLIGVAFFTFLLGLIPTHATLGYWAAILFFIFRMAKGVFSAGESTIAQTYLVEKKPYHDAFRASSWYQSSTMLGILIASVCAIMFPWRICFFLGGSIGILGYFLRKYDKTHPHSDDLPQHNPPLLQSLWTRKIAVFKMITLTGLSYVTYNIPFVVFNSLIPLLSNISLDTMMRFNILFLIFDTLLLLIAGPLLKRFETKNIIQVSIIMLLVIIPLISLLRGASFSFVTGLRIWIVFWGVMLCIPLNLYYRQLLDNNLNCYFIIGMANVLGSATIGASTPAICFALFNATGTPLSIAIYLSIVTLIALGSVFWKAEKVALSTTQSTSTLIP